VDESMDPRVQNVLTLHKAILEKVITQLGLLTRRLDALERASGYSDDETLKNLLERIDDGNFQSDASNGGEP